MLSAYITQRARGVYLASCYNADSGEEEFDAFPTVRAAKAWCAAWFGDERPAWVESPGDSAHWSSWRAEVAG